MRKILYIVIIAALMSSCVPQKLYVTNKSLPSNLGIHLVNSAKVPDNDWIYFTTAADSFINNYNSHTNRLKLYMSEIDSNSLNIDITENRYVTKDQQRQGLLVTMAGIITPFILIAAEAPIIVTFWYIPKNRTQFIKSLSKDLDASKNRVPQLIQSHHNFDSFEAQRGKQSQAFYQVLNYLVNEISINKKPPTTIVQSVYPDNLILNDGRELRCEVIKSDDEYVYFKFERDGKEFETHIDNKKVKNIQRDVF